MNLKFFNKSLMTRLAMVTLLATLLLAYTNCGSSSSNTSSSVAAAGNVNSALQQGYYSDTSGNSPISFFVSGTGGTISGDNGCSAVTVTSFNVNADGTFSATGTGNSPLHVCSINSDGTCTPVTLTITVSGTVLSNATEVAITNYDGNSVNYTLTYVGTTQPPQTIACPL